MKTDNLALPVAILAGGLATRLRPLTETVPKVMLDVGGRPFLEHQLQLLKQQGVANAVLCLGFLGEGVERYFGDGSRFGVKLKYSYDGPSLLGTGGALRRALPLLGEAFFVLYGDSYLQVDYHSVASTFLQSARSGLMTVFSNADKWDKSNVAFESGRVIAYNKANPSSDMKYIDYGLSVLRASAFHDYGENQAFDLSELLTKLASCGDLAGYEASERFYEIGSHSGLFELQRKLADV